MLSSFDTFCSDGGNGDVAKKISMGSSRPFDDDGYLGYDSRLPTQRLDAFSSVATPTDGDQEEVEDIIAADEPPTSGVGYDNIPVRHVSGDGSFPTSQEAFGYRPTDLLGDFASPEVPSPFSVPESNGMGFYEVDHEVGRAEGEFLVSEGPILPPPVEMEPEEGFIMQEWRRQNAIILEEKESKEKGLRNQIIAEAEEYKKAFHEKRKVNSETNKTHNREREKRFLANQENLSVNVDKQYWKAVSDLIPHEVPNIDKKRGKQDQEKKPSVVVVQGPKPGKPTDLSRLRQIMLKLKHNLPPHLKPLMPPAASAKDGASAVAASPAKQPVSSKEPTADGAKCTRRSYRNPDSELVRVTSGLLEF